MTTLPLRLCQPRQLRKDPHTLCAARIRQTTNPLSYCRSQGPGVDLPGLATGLVAAHAWRLWGTNDLAPHPEAHGVPACEGRIETSNHLRRDRRLGPRTRHGAAYDA
jgi:hypothetical protein